MKLLFSGRNRITSGYRLPERKDHNGLDIVGIDSRDILCPADGIVKSSTIVTDHSNLTWQWGNYVRVDDAQGRRLFFCHMDSRSVIAGQRVKQGDKLGIMGNTGYSFGAHTHFEVRDGDGKTILDPAEYLGIPNTCHLSLIFHQFTIHYQQSSNHSSSLINIYYSSIHLSLIHFLSPYNSPSSRTHHIPFLYNFHSNQLTIISICQSVIKPCKFSIY